MKRRRLDRIRHLDWAWQRCRAWFTFPPTILNVAEALGVAPCHITEAFDLGHPGRTVRGWNGGRLVAGAAPACASALVALGWPSPPKTPWKLDDGSARPKRLGEGPKLVGG